MSLLACPSCGRHTRAADPRCVHCDAPHADRPSPAKALLGLWLGAALSSGCLSQPLYGMTIADKVVTGDTGADSGDTGG